MKPGQKIQPQIQTECHQCGKVFGLRHSKYKQAVKLGRKKFCCSNQCSAKYRSDRASKIVKCETCNKSIRRQNWSLKRNLHNFCSTRCGVEARRGNTPNGALSVRKGKRHTFQCAHCGKSYSRMASTLKSQSGKTRFCSRKCLNLGRMNRGEARCHRCSKAFTRTKLKLNLQYRNYCSFDCYNSDRRELIVEKPAYKFTKRLGRSRPWHRIIMEEKIGRRLKSTEVVHHIDENPSNNHPDNLQLFASVGEHTEHHAALRRMRLAKDAA